MVIRLMAATSWAMLSRMIFSHLRSRNQLTRVDTEHGFRRNLKAIRAGFRQNLLCQGLHGRRQRDAGTEVEDAAGQDAGDLAEPLLVRQHAILNHAPSHAPPPRCLVLDVDVATMSVSPRP